MAKLKSEGKCLFCHQTLGKTAIVRHLNGHLEKLQAEQPGKKKAYHLRVGAGNYFLNLLVDGSLPLAELDDFLKAIWLECCGHLSSFKMKGKHYDSDWDFDAEEFGEKMKKRMDAVFAKDMLLDYEYDFGSTTELEIKVLEEYRLDVKEGILLLSRNEPLRILCGNCKKNPASHVNCYAEDEDDLYYCEDCIEELGKDVDDDPLMPVVNSPRMGVCGYTGGEIDKARDGVWQG